MALTVAETATTRSREVFLSLTSADAELANAIRRVFQKCFGNRVIIFDSTSRELRGGVGHGEDWFEWIGVRLRECDFAFFLVTPLSMNKPWIVWEAGAAYGIALSTGGDRVRKIRPIIYQIEEDKIPSPFKSLRVQFKRGDDFGDVKVLFAELVEHFRDLLTSDQLKEINNGLDGHIRTYLKHVSAGLTKAPLFEMADRYLKINASKWNERVKRKNDAAFEMATYLSSHHISKKDIVKFDNVDELREGLIVALAAAIQLSPREGDAELLLSVASDVERFHVKFRIAMAIGALLERCKITPKTAKSFEKIPGKV